MRLRSETMSDAWKVREQWRELPVVLRDLPLALALVAIGLVPAFQGYGTTVGTVPARPMDQLGGLIVMVQALPLALRRRAPILTVLVVSVGFAADQLIGYHSVAGIALPLALVSTGAHLERRRRVTAALLLLGYLAFAFALDRVGGAETIGGHLALVLVFAVAWGIGSWLRATRRAEAQRRELIAEHTRLAERTRIARDLHDVVTHHVTAMVVQAEAARYLTDRPEKLEESLDAMTDTGRRAISDLRRLLDLLNPGEGRPTDGQRVRSVHDLVEGTRLAGQPVTLREEGPAAGTDGAEEVALRVVQESLTNALKHAPGAPTVVLLRRSDATVDVHVTTAPNTGQNSLRNRAPVAPAGSGRGLRGLRRRVEERGGSLSAGPDGDAFTVHASIPRGDPR